MILDECKSCFFHAGETDDAIYCTCFGETITRVILPGAHGMSEVRFCPLEITDR